MSVTQRRKPDGRTRFARTVRDTRQAVLASLGRTPTHAESVIIGRIAQLSGRAKMIELQTDPSDEALRAYSAMVGTQAELLARLGLTPKRDERTYFKG